MCRPVPAELPGDGVTIIVRVTGYFAEAGGQAVPEMFCLITDLLDIGEYQAPELASPYRWRPVQQDSGILGGQRAGIIERLGEHGRAFRLRRITRKGGEPPGPVPPHGTWSASS